MPKKLSPKFLENFGKIPGRDKEGRLHTSKSERGRALAVELLEDPEYRDSLRKRLIAGVAGPIEIHLWRMGYGEPPKDDSSKAAEEERFRAMREQLQRYLKENAAEARKLNAVVTRAPRVLELPRPRLEPEPEPIDVEAVGGDGRPA